MDATRPLTDEELYRQNAALDPNAAGGGGHIGTQGQELTVTGGGSGAVGSGADPYVAPPLQHSDGALEPHGDGVGLVPAAQPVIPVTGQGTTAGSTGLGPKMGDKNMAPTNGGPGKDEFGDATKRQESPSGGLKDPPAAPPADPLEYGRAFGLVGGYDAGPVAMEKQDRGKILSAQDAKLRAAQAGARADLALNRASQPVLDEAAAHAQATLAQGQQNMARADAQTDDFMQRAAQATKDYEATKIEPQHYWNSMETPNKILTGLSLILGGAAGGWAGNGHNQALNVVTQNIQRDTEAQMQNRDAHLKAAGEFRSLAGIARDRFRNAGEAMGWINARKADETAAMLKALGAKYGDDKIKAETDAKAADIQAWGADQYNNAIKADNDAKLKGTEARKNNAEAARAGFLTKMDGVKFGLEEQRLRAKESTQMVNDPDTGKPMVGKDGRPIIHEKAFEINKALGELASVDDGLQQTIGKLGGIGWGEATANGAYNAALASALAPLPEGERAAIANAIPGPNSVGTPAEALAAARSMINVRKSRLRQAIGGAPAVSTIGGTQHTPGQ